MARTKGTPSANLSNPSTRKPAAKKPGTAMHDAVEIYLASQEWLKTPENALHVAALRAAAASCDKYPDLVGGHALVRSLSNDLWRRAREQEVEAPVVTELEAMLRAV